ncbi:MAG: hypothetical protein R6U50_06570 [Desulfobacterales bacterium]
MALKRITHHFQAARSSRLNGLLKIREVELLTIAATSPLPHRRGKAGMGGINKGLHKLKRKQTHAPLDPSS